MAKRWRFLLLTLLLAVGMAVPAAADVIWEPEDSFFESHRDECSYVGRAYMAAGYDDEVFVYTKPNGAARYRLPNGERCQVQFRWSGEDQDWAYLYSDAEGGVEGWAPMGDLSLIYDSQQFMEDHSAQLENLPQPLTVDFTKAVLYSYPGGPTSGELIEDERYMPFSEVFSTLYTDEDGLRWGYIGYYMGHRNSWVCLDAPVSEELDTNVVEPEPSQAQQWGAPSYNAGAGNALPMIAALVAAVMAVTVALIQKQHPKQKKN